jgi:hypothetical protein
MVFGLAADAFSFVRQDPTLDIDFRQHPEGSQSIAALNAVGMIQLDG